MSIQTPAGTTPPAPPATPVSVPQDERGRWAMSWPGVRTVMSLDLRQRVRSSRWRLMLTLFFLTIGALSVLVMAVSGFDDESGGFLYGAVVGVVLSLGLLVAPALTSTSVNGDRAAGTLAPLQMTLLSPAEIAIGKLLAGWLTSLAFLGTAVPFLVLAMLPGGTSLARLLVTIVMMALMLLILCAIALGWSAVSARSVTSAVMTYLTTAFLCLGTLFVFGLSYPLVTEYEDVRVLQDPHFGPKHDWSKPIPRSDCVEVVAERPVAHTEATWWLLAANPYVVVADAAPGGQDEDLFSVIKAGVRTAQAGPQEPIDECWSSREFESDEGLVDDDYPGLPVWPFGLVINLGLGALGVVAAVRRLTIPVRRLPRGTRIA
ncbi:ABC transporter permease [Nocardioides sp. 616]|uniref:ABC transporter permease n=1 Tax=Nocardioides sp. 616 TaxID=2268090 RepID=UPI001965C1DF|nr:ABC transporter permease [Nocardioides sp. 616]